MTLEELNQLFPAYADCAVSVGNDRSAALVVLLSFVF